MIQTVRKTVAPASSDAIRDFTDAVLGIFRLNGSLIAWGDRFGSPLGLTSARWQMLGAIALSARPLTAPQLAASMGVTRQGAQKQLNLLHADGLVQRMDNPRHPRSPQYCLTARGRDLYARIEKLWLERAARFTQQLPANDIIAARRFVLFLRNALDDDLQGTTP